MFGQSTAPSEVRPSSIAGTWYPGTAASLSGTLERFLAGVPEQALDGDLVALVAPHAGYVYSGQVAAYAYKLIEGQQHPRVVVLSPAHRPYPGGLLVTAMRHYGTPLGSVEVDRATVDRLAEQVTITRLQHDDEHSIEIQLPFLQHILGEFVLVPLMMRDQSWEDCQALAEALDHVLGEEQPLLVASSDLCHAHSYEHVLNTDAATLAALERGDPQEFWQTASRLQGACGYGAVTTTLLLARRWGASRVVLLHSTNSGDVTGNRAGYVVGYAAAAIVR